MSEPIESRGSLIHFASVSGGADSLAAMLLAVPFAYFAIRTVLALIGA